jgi:type IV secretory pathway VirB2 component (pilin)
LTDVSSASPLVAAVFWLEAVLLGTLATTVAIIAVATVGFLMLTGRIDIKRGLTVVVGCFILFGASSIATNLDDMTQSLQVPERSEIPSTPIVPIQAPIQSSTRSPAAYDPYAGAAIPSR